MFKFISILAVSFVATSAFAVDTSLCPAQIPFKADVTKVYASSIYKDTPGWKEAQRNLSQTSSFKTAFTMIKKSKDACFYTDDFGNTAKLSSFTFNDPEENVQTPTDQLSVSLRVENSKYVTFIPVKFYTVRGVVLHSTPFAVKIKASLTTPSTNRFAAYDMGMVSVSLD